MSDKQKTLKEAITISGAGLHTGQNVNLTFRPAPINHGFKFRRIDLPDQPVIDADADLVTDTSRGTTLEYKGVKVSTVEHCLAALTGMDIDNALIDLDCQETPILDGSARYYVEAIKKTGVVEQEAERQYFTITEVLRYSDPEKKTELLILPDDTYKVSVMIDYDTKVLGTQNAHLSHINEFADEIAPCRTFVFLHELEFLIQNNLIKGGDLSNAIVFVNRLISPEELDRLAKFFNKPEVKVLKEGILNNLQLAFNNEPARHKLLDVVGDLSLVGTRIKGHVIASRPGHLSNTHFARIIKQHIRHETSQPLLPKFDLNKPPLFDINDIKRILPHRPPFLLVDKILNMSDHDVVGLKNVTMNEGFFVGHFPDEPVMPGVLIIEAMAQSGGIFVLSSVPDPENYITYFMKIDNVRFRQKVVPGDTLIFHLDLISPFRRGISHMKGTAYVGTKIVAEAELMAQITKKIAS
ncbi:MAG: bifunctional UDP-3-O-[3-hydroxymyristoyl] N-acetylglucosamine deacetylase/3-hydroxyacyl-ACP dehydratase [Lentimicrobium sp.]|nr:bifunctional UDP-3-O-[3-hydroxymyristoyl] N-acetylglucosamine deacetylase/3-hydroxyacyl-ACP dehydratase [Lentimicrobium sp.]